ATVSGKCSSTMPLRRTPREGGRSATTREPGDLPATRREPSPSGGGQKGNCHAKHIHRQRSRRQGQYSAARHSRPARHFHHRLRRVLPYRGRAQCQPRLSPFHGLSLPLTGVSMAVFRSVVFLAALAGLVAGVAMTGLQSFFTVPLILKAETY